MAASLHQIKVLDICRVSPPPASVAETSLPLTFFDVFWLQLPPVQRILFYEFSDINTKTTTTTHFLQTLIPQLRHSLSLALQIFYPLAGNLVVSPKSGEHEIRYVDGDSVSLTVTESDSDFHRLVSNNPKNATEFHPLAPELLTSELLSLQVTLFPNSGVCIGVCLHHLAADGRALAHFMKSWASIHRTGNLSSVAPLPFLDRSVIDDPTGLKRLFLEQMEEFRFGKKVECLDVQTQVDPVRVTFLLTRSDIERLRQRVMARVEPNQKPPSTFALTCGYVWVCLSRAREEAEDKTAHFSFSVDCRNWLDPPIPDTYFGNCIAVAFVEAKGTDFGKEDGFVTATMAIKRAVEGLSTDGALKGAENCIPRIIALANVRIVSVAGSPRFRIYDTDFGWGRPTKTEVVSIDRTQAIYMGDSREEEGGIEIGLAIPTTEIERFAFLFQEGLKF